MARVNRSTGTFVILGVVLLLVSVTGTRWLMHPGDPPAPPAPPPAAPNEPDVFCQGQVDAPGGLSPLVPGIPGRVAAILVREDQPVKQGEVILRLDDKVEQMKLQAAESALNAARARLESAKIDLKKHDIELTKQQALADAARGLYAKARTYFQAIEKNYELKLVKEPEYLLARQDLTNAKGNLDSAEKALAQFKAIDPTLALREHEENLKKAEKEVAAAQAALDLFSVKAPFAGRCILINIRPGEQFGGLMIPGSLPPIVFCPEGDLVVRAEVNQDRAWLVKPGMAVTLQDKSPGRNHEWRGTVQRVSPWMRRPLSVMWEPGQANDVRTRECLIRVTADPDNPLIIGQAMRVRIHINGRQ